MSNYRPPREGENDAEFWQRLREMAQTMERDLDDRQRQAAPGSRAGSSEHRAGAELSWPRRRGHKRVDAPRVHLVDLSKHAGKTG